MIIKNIKRTIYDDIQLGKEYHVIRVDNHYEILIKGKNRKFETLVCNDKFISEFFEIV